MAAAAVAAILVVGGCYQVRDPDVEPPPDPFVRYPYLQAVSDSSAWILWTSESAGPDTLVYWIEDPGSGEPDREPDRERSGPRPPDTVRVAVPAGEGARTGPDRRSPSGGSSSGSRAAAHPDVGRRYLARIGGLPARARIGYRVVTADPHETSGTHSFRTAPSRGSPDRVTALVFGDSGTGDDDQVALSEIMRDHAYDLILHTGDVAYFDGEEYALTHRHFRVYRDLMAEVPFFPTLGNHDVRTDGGLPFRRAFVLPGLEPPDRRAYYSFDWGSVHFVGLDTAGGLDRDQAADIRARGRQYEWLVDDLSRAAADPDIRWIVVFFHHPPYSSAAGLVGHASDLPLQASLVPLFDLFGVDLVVAGHDHHYERSRPLRFGEVDEDTPGTVYLVTGGGGGDPNWRAVVDRWHTASSSFQHHFVILQTKVDRLAIHTVDRVGRLIDYYEIAPVPPGDAPPESDEEDDRERRPR